MLRVLVALRSGWLFGALLVMGLPWLCRTANAETFIIPHVIYNSGSISDPNNFDTSLHVALAGSASGTEGPVDVDLYLFDETGDYARDAGSNPVCDPCKRTLSSASGVLRTDFDFDSFFTGGHPGLFTGYAAVVTSGDTERLGLQTFIVNSVSGPFETHLFAASPAEILTGSAPDTWVLPHWVAIPGTVSDPNNFDTILYAVYLGGSRIIPEGTGAKLHLYLYDDGGQPTTDAVGTPVCAPCTYLLDGTNPKETIRFDSLFLGGQASSVEIGYAVVTANGDTERLALQALLVNSHSGAFDVSMTEPILEPVVFSEVVAVSDLGSSPLRIDAQPSPFRASVALELTLPSRAGARLSIHDVRGREVAVIVDETLERGPHRFLWDARDAAGTILPSGVYFARASADGMSVTRKLVLAE